MSIDRFFDTFNAKYLTFQEVAETFIYTDKFEQLKENKSTLLMGPRGSGKTTLLKLLSPAGLHYWKGHEAEKIKPEINFTAIYIPSDIHWKRQMQMLDEEPGIDHKTTEIISRSIVTANILHSVLDCFSSLVKINKTLENKEQILKAESNICEFLIDAWTLSETTGMNFQGLKLGIELRIADINKLVKRITRIGYSEDKIDLPNYFDDYYLDQIRLALSIFEKELDKVSPIITNIKKWALCFDELEIAPKWLQAELIDNLRGKDSNIIYKLTTAPIVSLYRNEDENSHYNVAAEEDNDFIVVRTWNHNRDASVKWEDFSRELVKKRLLRKFGESVLPEDFIGKNDLDRVMLQELPPNEKPRALSKRKNDKGVRDNYGSESPFWFILRSLGRSDKSFKRYLINQEIDPENPIPKNPNQIPSVHRKIKPLAVFRYVLSKGSSRARSRKVVPLFYGVETLSNLSDGNPRALISLIDELTNNVRKDKRGKLTSLSINAQSKILANISKRFYDHIDNHPEATENVGYQKEHLSYLFERMGDFLHRTIIRDNFKADPRGTFIFDESLKPLRNLFQLALYRGFIIYINPNEAVCKEGIIGKEFRFNYMLTPHFKIPPNKFESPYKLSDVLVSKKAQSKLKKNEDQTEIFGKDGD